MVDVITASCCTPVDVQRKIESVLTSLKQEIPELNWNVHDIDKQPELALKYASPMTPAIFIDGKLELVGYPKQADLEAKVRAHAHK
jgi:protein-disulfide isomerase